MPRTAQQGRKIVGDRSMIEAIDRFGKVEMIKRIAHVSIASLDLEATLRFHVEGGCEKAFDFIRDDEVVGFYLRLAESTFVQKRR